MKLRQTTLSALVMLLAGIYPCAKATTLVDFRWVGDSRYSAVGSFLYNEAITPSSFSEMGAGSTKYLQSFSVSFFTPQGTVLESGNSIINGVSSDRFFRLDYNTQSRTISSLDADIGGSSYQYFLTNLRTPNGNVVPPGVTTFNFFYRPNADSALDSAGSVQITSVSQVPEPSTASLLLLSGLGGCALVCRRKAVR